MAWTKLNFYLTMIFTAIVLFTGLGIVGTSIINSDRLDMNERSVDYLLELKGVNTDSGFSGVANTSSAETQEKGILDSEDDLQVSENNDFLSTLFIKKERASAPTNFLKFAYNIPSSILIGLGLPLDDWKYVTNILGYILFIALLILIWSWIRP